MKNKKMLYILIPGTLLVWGLIIYKIFLGAHSDEGTIFAPVTVSKVNEDVISDTFSISPMYRDPFLGRVQGGHSDNSKPLIPKTPVMPVVDVPKVWPNIVYGGIIKNQNLKKELLLVEINGQSHAMKVGETIDGVLISKAFRDSVEVQFSKEKKIIRK